MKKTASNEYISPRRLAIETGVTYSTIIRWVRNQYEGRGRLNPIKGVKRGENGYYQIKIENVGRVREFLRNRSGSDGMC